MAEWIIEALANPLAEGLTVEKLIELHQGIECRSAR
jgi:hypothetical protein